MKVEELESIIAGLHPAFQGAVQNFQKLIGEAKSSGELPKFFEGDCVLIARNSFTMGEIIFLSSRVKRRVSEAIDEYVFQV